MRLINIHTLEFKEFLDSDIPPYCILSHRWGDDEITYKEFRKGLRKDSAGYRKVIEFCDFVKQRQFIVWDLVFDSSNLPPSYKDLKSSFLEVSWIWVDTCCIDKKSSAELSEAINCMFRWYEQAVQCVAYLADVPDKEPRSLEQSSWFQRGWTLQELLAPMQFIVCNAEWQVLGHKCGHSPFSFANRECILSQESAYGLCLLDVMSRITKIPEEFLLQELRGRYIYPHPFRNATVAQRLSWTASRSTSRIEDEAYCLLGIFSINMPLIYGEGKNAFQRLQVEIVNSANDPSIFAHGEDLYPPSIYPWSSRLFARAPDSFLRSGRIEAAMRGKRDLPEVIQIRLWKSVVEATTLLFDDCRRVPELEVYHDHEDSLFRASGRVLLRLCCTDKSVAIECHSQRSEIALLLEQEHNGEYRKIGSVTTKLFAKAPRTLLKRRRITILT